MTDDRLLLDVRGLTVRFPTSDGVVQAVSPHRGAEPDPEALATVAELLAGARRPVVVLGTDDATPWDFKCSAGANANKWSTLPVPSCWDTAG